MKFIKILEKGKYALILRNENLDEYAVVYGLNEDRGDWECTSNDSRMGTGYWNFGKYSPLDQAKALQKAVDYFRVKTEQTIEQEMPSEQIANILINMSLDMDYADYLEYYDESIKKLASSIDSLLIRCPELYTALEMIALKNSEWEDWAIMFDREENRE